MRRIIPSIWMRKYGKTEKKKYFVEEYIKGNGFMADSSNYLLFPNYTIFPLL